MFKGVQSRLYFPALALACLTACASGAAPAPPAPADSVTWTLDSLDRIGGHPVTVLGNPRLIDAPPGKAVQFDGVDDGLVVDEHPLAGAAQFTVEIVFRPDADPPDAEPRFLNLQEEGTENRILIELRHIGGGRWFLDSYVHSNETNEALFARDFLHAAGEWHHAAFVCDSRRIRHYVDGVFEMSKPIPGWTPAGPGKTSIGVRMNRVKWFKGAVRTVRFTRRALEPEAFLKPGQ